MSTLPAITLKRAQTRVQPDMSGRNPEFRISLQSKPGTPRRPHAVQQSRKIIENKSTKFLICYNRLRIIKYWKHKGYTAQLCPFVPQGKDEYVSKLLIMCFQN